MLKIFPIKKNDDTPDILKEIIKDEFGLEYEIEITRDRDSFYDFDKDMWKKYSKMGVLVVEMESFALYINAEYLGKKALTMLTVTDSFFKEGRLTTEQRQTGLRLMISAAIELAEKHA